jgi:hypothetical protein
MRETTIMKKLFVPNIDWRGRVIRGVLGIFLVVAGIFILVSGRWFGLALIPDGGFCFFEAARGWCVMRACGVKTKY